MECHRGPSRPPTLSFCKVSVNGKKGRETKGLFTVY